MAVESAFYGFPGGKVTFNTEPLPMPTEARETSPTGYSWGYAGSGCYALAYSILHRACGQEVADRYAMGFKFDVIAALPFGEPFALTHADVRQWAQDSLSNAK